MDPAKLLDSYLTASRKKPFLENALEDASDELLAALQGHAVKRYASRTLTLTELKLFAHDLATVCSKPAAEQLYLAIASTHSCCVRTANLQARARLDEWLSGDGPG